MNTSVCIQPDYSSPSVKMWITEAAKFWLAQRALVDHDRPLVDHKRFGLGLTTKDHVKNVQGIRSSRILLIGALILGCFGPEPIKNLDNQSGGS